MTDHFIKLNCPQCGGTLEIYNDMEHFACGYCGTAMVTQRRGGTVLLKAVADAIKNVQIGTDKTAAELAIARLSRDLTELNQKLTELRAHQKKITGKNDAAKSGIGVSIFLLLSSIIPAWMLTIAHEWNQDEGKPKLCWFVVIVFLGVIAFFKSISGLKLSELRTDNAKILAIINQAKAANQRIQENKKIADG